MGTRNYKQILRKCSSAQAHLLLQLRVLKRPNYKNGHSSPGAAPQGQRLPRGQSPNQERVTGVRDLIHDTVPRLVQLPQSPAICVLMCDDDDDGDEM